VLQPINSRKELLTIHKDEPMQPTTLDRHFVGGQGSQRKKTPQQLMREIRKQQEEEEKRRKRRNRK